MNSEQKCGVFIHHLDCEFQCQDFQEMVTWIRTTTFILNVLAYIVREGLGVLCCCCFSFSHILDKVRVKDIRFDQTTEGQKHKMLKLFIIDKA